MVKKEYKVAGITFDNEENKDIQKELKRLLKEYVSTEIITKDDMYGGNSNADIKEYDLTVSQYEDIDFKAKLVVDSFEGKPCVKVYIQNANQQDYTHIGYIQDRYNQITEVINILGKYNIVSVTLNIIGGKIKSCVDDSIETDELTYGAKVILSYLDPNEQIKTQNTIEDNEEDYNYEKKEKIFTIFFIILVVLFILSMIYTIGFALDKF